MPDDALPPAETGGGPSGAVPEAPPDPMAAIGEKLDKILSILSSLLEEEAQEHEGGEQPEATPADETGTQASDLPCDGDSEKCKKGKLCEKMSAVDYEVPGLVARLAALEAKDKARETSDKLSRVVAKAKSDLAGWPLTAKIEEQIRFFAEKGGQEAVDRFVVTYKESCPRDPPGSFRDFEGTGFNNDPAEVLKFSAKGPAALEAARAAWREWNSLKESLPTFKVSLDRFIEQAVNGVNLGR